MHSKVLRHDATIWQTFFPPNSFKHAPGTGLAEALTHKQANPPPTG
ncbi:hypothetical protein QZH47_09875 [Pseudomonas corrugata]